MIPQSTSPYTSPNRIKNSGNRANYGDRFIPSRVTTNLEDAFSIMENKELSTQHPPKSDVPRENQMIMNSLLRAELLGQQEPDYHVNTGLDGQMQSPSRRESSSSNLFKYRTSKGSRNSTDSQFSSSNEFLTSSPVASFSSNASPFVQKNLHSPKKPTRKISKTPFKVLDAPSLQDDYYLNLVDWSHHNILSVALGPSVYLWSACTSKVTKLCDLAEDDTVTSICWATSGNNIAVGTNSGKIQIWDVGISKKVQEMSPHTSRVGTMAWNSTLLATGSRDRNIYLQDMRIRGNSGLNSSQTGISTSQNHRNNGTNRGFSSIAGNNGLNERGLNGINRESNNANGGNNLNNSVQPGFISALDLLRRNDTHVFSPNTTNNTNTDNSIGSASINNSSTTDQILGLNNLTSAVSSGTLPISRGFETFSVHSSSISQEVTNHNSVPGANVVRQLSAHKQEVCGLKWSFDEKMLASGGNDNKLFVWSANGGTSGTPNRPQQGHFQQDPLFRFEDHTAAVKAVGWSPHQPGLLVSGGGTADRHIRFWNCLTGVPLHKVDTGSQVCNLMWSKNVNEIVSTHGYSLNQVIVWRYPTMQKIATLTGHSLRVLYLAMSPDGQTIVTGAGDETLRFWNVFPGARGRAGGSLGPSLLVPSGDDIR